ncbi:MAG: virulence protein RhuM/Fic/DOC family protein [Alphaproteobacteria bacterium]|nr:MAG: virulence protein RhuM/Fic/DOC family protein [Alphaproteobacteria bacterium]
MSEIVIYAQEGHDVEVRLQGETVWLTQRQMADLLETSTDNISLHIANIYEAGELLETATTEESSVVQTEGKRQVKRKVKLYNLDVIISVAYRVNSKRGVRFRQWATRVLNEHLTKGYTLNRQRLENNARELEAALRLVQHTTRTSALTADEGRGLVEILGRYTQTFLLLQRYDEGTLTDPAGTGGGTLPTLAEARIILATLKADLAARGQASDLFARERGESFEAILGNLQQSVLGEPAYPTIEAKAAHLLYFVIKNHPFSDGNKRSAACLFIDFLHRNRAFMRNGQPVINDIGLAALALLVAESAPDQKETMIRLIMNMLAPSHSNLCSMS